MSSVCRPFDTSPLSIVCVRDSQDEINNLIKVKVERKKKRDYFSIALPAKGEGRNAWPH